MNMENLAFYISLAFLVMFLLRRIVVLKDNDVDTIALFIVSSIYCAAGLIIHALKVH